MELEFFETYYTVRLREVTNCGETISGRGDISNTAMGYLIFSIKDGRLSASIEIPDTASGYHINYEVESGRHVVYERDGSFSDSETSSISDMNFETTENSMTGITTVNVMVLYTPSAAGWAETNQGGIGNAINLANQQANLVMENSETGVWLNLVHTMEVDYHETGEDLDTDLTRLAYKNGYMDDIHDLRDYHGADLVSMFIKTSGNIAGMAYGPTEEYHLIPNAAFSVVSVQHASSNYVYIHELGHHFGAGHAKDQDIYPGPQLYDYSAGWRWITGTWPGRRRYRTVMAYNTFDYGLFDYECVPYFSNPDITHWDNDEPIGCYVDANNARTIRETKHIIANYQQPTPQVTTATVSGGQEFYEGTEQEIRWDTISGNNGIAGIDIYLLSLYSNEQMQIARGIRDTGSYLWSVPNEPGDFTIMVRATDRAGFSRTTSVDHPFEILEDNYPPEIEIISPDFGDIFNYNRISVSWNGNDDYSGIDHYEIRTLCLPWVRVDSESFTLDIDIDGHNTIYVMARDRACNTNTDTVDLLLDTQEPYVHIYFPIPLSVIQTPDVEVKWDGFDLLSGVSHYEISLNGGDFERIYNTTHTFLDVDEGDHNVTIRAFDNAGNVATTYVEFTVEDRSSLDFIIDLIDSNSWTWIFIIFLTSSLLGLIVISIDKNRKKYSYPHKNWSRTNEVECGNCFTTIASHYTSCPRCGVDFRHDMVKCNNCSSMVDSRASRCPECGLYF